MKKTIFLTGATGVMGAAGLKELSKKLDRFNVTVLARDSKINRKKLAQYMDMGVKVVWGNLLKYEDVLAGVTGADYVLHVGGMVSPAADYYPKRTIKTNVGAAENIAKAVLAQPNKDNIKVVYIGTVAQTSDRSEPIHWGRTGDPICISVYDHYAISKTQAEKVIVESGIKNWVSLRQSGILHPGILSKRSTDLQTMSLNVNYLTPFHAHALKRYLSLNGLCYATSTGSGIRTATAWKTISISEQMYL